MFQAVSETYENLTDLKGRITRKQYWSTWLFNVFILILAAFLAEFLYSLAFLLYVVVTVITAIKRAHDVGYAGFYILIPLFNFIILISNSDVNENKWGPPVN